MIRIKEIALIIENITLLLQYFIPGFWMLCIVRFLTHKKLELTPTFVMSVVFSYILKSIIAIFYHTTNLLLLSGIMVIIFAILGILYSYVVTQKWFANVLIKLFHQTPYDNIWGDVLNFQEGSNLKVYLTGKNYYVLGHYKANEEKGNDSWFAISAFQKRDINDDKVIGPSYLDRDDVIMTFRLSDVERMEIF